MTKWELSQLRYLDGEIALLQQQLTELRDRPPGQSAAAGDGMPSGHKRDALGDYVAVVADLEQQLLRYIRRRTLERKRLHRYIQSVEDTQMRQILTLRYARGLPWCQVAMELGGGNTANAIFQRHKRFLEQN